jgi:hypothetical protein
MSIEITEDTARAARDALEERIDDTKQMIDETDDSRLERRLSLSKQLDKRALGDLTSAEL